MLRLLLFAIIALALAPRGLLAGPADDRAELMGQAIHHFQAGNDLAAFPLLTLVIDAQHADPRAYFYRGLIAWRMGNVEQARRDFRAGAALEAADPDPHAMTSIQIYRIQGAARQMLEHYRADARLTAYQRREQARWARFRGVDDRPPVTSNGEPSNGEPSVPGIHPTPSATPTVTPTPLPADPFKK